MDSIEKKPKSEIKFNKSKLEKAFNHKLILIKKISFILNKIIKCNEENKTITPSLFDNKKLPKINIEKYLERIMNYSEVSYTTLIYSLALIDKLCIYSKINLSYHNIYKIIISSFIIAVKMNEDGIYGEKIYSLIGGISIKDLAYLEANFLDAINYKANITETVIENYLKSFKC